jgi:hypothetical protein
MQILLAVAGEKANVFALEFDDPKREIDRA